MACSILRISVRNFETWLPFMQGFEDMRKTAGSRGAKLFRSADDGNDLVIILEWDSLENGRKFNESRALAAVMEKAGVVGVSTTLYAEEVVEGEY